MHIINLNEEVKRETKRIRKQYGLKLPDAIIVAMAIYLHCRLLTANQQFFNLPELDVTKAIP